MRYDSIRGRYDGTIEADGDSLVVDGKRVALSHTRDPVEIPFTDPGAEYVYESMCVSVMTERTQLWLKVSAKKAVFSARAKDDLHTWAIEHELKYVLAIDAGCLLCIVHYGWAGSYGEGDERCLQHQEGLDDDSPRHDSILADGGWLFEEGLARMSRGVGQHSSLLDRRGEGCRQGDPRGCG